MDYINLEDILARDKFLNEKFTWILSYKACKYINQIYINYLIQNAIEHNIETWNFKIVIEKSGQIKLIPAKKDEEDKPLTSVINANEHDSIKLERVLEFEKCNGPRNNTIKNDRHFVNVEKQLVSHLGLQLLRAMFNQDTDIAEASIQLNIGNSNSKDENFKGPTPSPFSTSNLSRSSSNSNYLYLPNSRHNTLVSEDIVDLLDAMILDQGDNYEQLPGPNVYFINQKTNSKFDASKQNTMPCNNLHDEGIESDTVSGQSEEHQPLGTQNNTLTGNDAFGIQCLQNIPQLLLGEDSGEEKSSSFLSHNSSNSLSSPATSDDENNASNAANATLTHNNNNNININTNYINANDKHFGADNQMEILGGLKLGQVIKKCLYRLRTLYPSLNADQLEAKFSQELRSLAHGFTDVHEEDSALCKIIKQSKLNLGDLINGKVDEIPLTNLTDNMDLIGKIWPKDLLDLGSSHFDNFVISNNHWNVSNINKHSQIYPHQNCINEIKTKFPTLKKCPAPNQKLSDSNDLHSNLLSELKTKRPKLKKIQDAISHRSAENLTAPSLNRHEKLMSDIQNGKALKHVITMDKSIPKICVDPALSMVRHSTETDLNDQDEFDETLDYFGHATKNNHNGQKMFSHCGSHVAKRRSLSPNPSPPTALENENYDYYNDSLLLEASVFPSFSCNKHSNAAASSSFGHQRFSSFSLNRRQQPTRLIGSNLENGFEGGLNIDKNPHMLSRVNARLSPDTFNFVRSRSVRIPPTNSTPQSSIQNCYGNPGDTTTISLPNETRPESNGHLLHRNASLQVKRKSLLFNSDSDLSSSSSHRNGANNTINLNFKEFCAIRTALRNSIMEEFFHTDQKLYKNLKAKKVCHDCKKALWSVFGNQGVTCSVCSKTLCSNCHEKIMITSLHLSNISTKFLTPIQIEQKQAQKCQNFFKTTYVLPEADIRSSVFRGNSTSTPTNTSSPSNSKLTTQKNSHYNNNIANNVNLSASGSLSIISNSLSALSSPVPSIKSHNPDLSGLKGEVAGRNYYDSAAKSFSTLSSPHLTTDNESTASLRFLDSANASQHQQILDVTKLPDQHSSQLSSLTSVSTDIKSYNSHNIKNFNNNNNNCNLSNKPISNGCNLLNVDMALIPKTPILSCNECMIILRRSYLFTKLAKK